METSQSAGASRSDGAANTVPLGMATKPTWPIPFAALTRLLSLIVPYALGRAYASGWWDGLGLGDWPVDYAIDDYLYLGFVALLNGTARFIGDGVVARVATVAIGAVLTVVLWYLIDVAAAVVGRRTRRMRLGIRRRLARLARNKHVYKVGVVAIGTTFLTLAAMAAWLWLATVLVAPIALAENVGRAEARRMKADLAKPDKASKYPVVFLTEPVTTNQTTRLLQCASDWCVVSAGTDVFLVPKGSVEQAGPRRLLQVPSGKSTASTIPTVSAPGR